MWVPSGQCLTEREHDREWHRLEGLYYLLQVPFRLEHEQYCLHFVPLRDSLTLTILLSLGVGGPLQKDSNIFFPTSKVFVINLYCADGEPSITKAFLLS